MYSFVWFKTVAGQDKQKLKRCIRNLGLTIKAEHPGLLPITAYILADIMDAICDYASVNEQRCPTPPLVHFIK